MKHLWTLLVVGVVGFAQPASKDREAVLAVVDQFMTAISTSDPALMTKVRVPGAVDFIEGPNPAGGTMVRSRPFNPENLKGRNFRERYWDPVVHIRGSIAVVWTPYEFWQDGKTSHCGIDVFNIVKQDGVWKIANALWTVEPDACPQMRPSDPKRIRPQ